METNTARVNWRTVKAVGLIALGTGLILLKVMMGWPSLDELRGSPKAPSVLVLGRSRLVVPHGALVGAQVDRVVRDVAWTGSPWDRRVDPTRVPSRPEDLVPYMEGRLIRDLMRHAAVRVQPLTPVTARRAGDGFWYAADAGGAFRFEIDESKIRLATGRRLGPDEIQIVDTHGFSAIVEPALQHRPFLAVACMDSPGKAAAALYLATRGIHAYAPEDRFGGDLIGYRLHRPQAATIIGSAPIRPGPRGSAVIGGQPVTISLDEPIVVQWTENRPPWYYNDTPWRYFTALAGRYFLDLKLFRVHANAGEMDRVIAEARRREAKVVAVRVGKATSDAQAEHDARVLSRWLSERPDHRAVLFHSAPYEPGYQLFFKFPTQTTFGDFDPEVR